MSYQGSASPALCLERLLGRLIRTVVGWARAADGCRTTFTVDHMATRTTISSFSKAACIANCARTETGCLYLGWASAGRASFPNGHFASCSSFCSCHRSRRQMPRAARPRACAGIGVIASRATGLSALGADLTWAVEGRILANTQIKKVESMLSIRFDLVPRRVSIPYDLLIKSWRPPPLGGTRPGTDHYSSYRHLGTARRCGGTARRCGVVRSYKDSVTCYLLLSCLQGAALLIVAVTHAADRSAPAVEAVEASPGGDKYVRYSRTALTLRSSFSSSSSAPRGAPFVDYHLGEARRRSCDRNDRGIGLSPGARNTIMDSRLDVKSCSRHTTPTGGSITRGEALICTTDE